MAKKDNTLKWVAIGVVALFLFGVFSLKDGSLKINNPLSVAGGGVDTTGQVQPSSGQFVSDSVITQAYEAESGSLNPSGSITLFQKGVDPSDPSASQLAVLDLGTAYTGADVVCGKEYSVLYNDSTTHYAKWFGDKVLIDCDTEYNKENGDSLVDITAKFGFNPTKVATIDDILSENSSSVNGQTPTATNWSDGTLEIQCTQKQQGCDVDGTLVYDESAADGTFFIDIAPSASGSQAILSEPVLCFVYDATTPPEGNEVSSMTVNLRSGNDLGLTSNLDWVNIFGNEECAKMTNMAAGQSGTYRLTITYSEANLDTGDDYTIVFDDLGSDRGKDDFLGLGATRDVVTLDAQA